VHEPSPPTFKLHPAAFARSGPTAQVPIVGQFESLEPGEACVARGETIQVRKGFSETGGRTETLRRRQTTNNKHHPSVPVRLEVRNRVASGNGKGALRLLSSK
jgi:hypothetical protein